MTKQEIIDYLKSEDTRRLFQQADKARRQYCGEEVFIRGLVEFSNYCIRNCQYCGLRRDNVKAQRYRMTITEIIEIAKQIIDLGIETIVLQSGDDFFYTRQKICRIIEKIKKAAPSIAVTLSIGERPLDDYKAFRESGADRYLLRHETINERLYKKLHPGQTLSCRLSILCYLRKIGFQIGAGHIVGLPGQTVEDSADEILFYQDFQPDMIGMGPFISQQDTPLAQYNVSDFDMVLRCLALTRIVTANTLLPATTAVATINSQEGINKALSVGCNVIMVNFALEKYQKNYQIYDNKIQVPIETAQAAVREQDRQISFKRGDSFKSKGVRH